MRRTWQRISIVAALVVGAAFWTGNFSFRGETAAVRAAEGEGAADSPDKYIWTLVYRIATKPEGETVAGPMGTQYQMKVLYTFVKEFRVRPDGTFAFEDCDVGHCIQESVLSIGQTKINSRTNWQGLLRGSGKWQPATPGTDETLTLKLECGAGAGTSQTGDDKASVVSFTVSPDGRTVTTTGGPAAKPISYSYPNPFVASEWTLKSNQVVPDGRRGAIQGRGLKVFPVSYLLAAEEKCEDKEEPKFEGGRPTELICAAGPRTPVTETVEVTKKEKKADLSVTFRGDKIIAGEPGSSGTFTVVVSNHGPCKTPGTVFIRMYPSSTARMQNPAVTDSNGESSFAFSLGPGNQATFSLPAKDITPSGQAEIYFFHAGARVIGELPDPIGLNNYAFQDIMFKPSGPAPAKPK